MSNVLNSNRNSANLDNFNLGKNRNRVSSIGEISFHSAETMIAINGLRDAFARSISESRDDAIKIQTSEEEEAAEIKEMEEVSKTVPRLCHMPVMF